MSPWTISCCICLTGFLNVDQFARYLSSQLKRFSLPALILVRKWLLFHFGLFPPVSNCRKCSPHFPELREPRLAKWLNKAHDWDVQLDQSAFRHCRRSSTSVSAFVRNSWSSAIRAGIGRFVCRKTGRLFPFFIGSLTFWSIDWAVFSKYLNSSFLWATQKKPKICSPVLF